MINNVMSNISNDTINKRVKNQSLYRNKFV